MLESGEITDHKIRNRSDITTIYGGLGPSIVIIAITLESIAIRNRSDIRTTDEGPDHFWSSNRNFNEVNYAFQHSIDDKSRVLFDKLIVWPVTHLVLTRVSSSNNE